MQSRPFASWLGRSILLSMAVAPVISAQQYALQHTNTIPLSSVFNFGDVPNGIPQSAYGTNPLSIAFDGTSLYIGGYNTSGAAATVGVARIDGPLTTTTSITGLASSQFTAPASRGIDAMAALNPNEIFLGHDSGASGTSLIRKINSSGTTLFEVNPGNRVNALAIDPIGDAGAPAVGWLTRDGVGRRLAVKAADLTTLYTPSGGANPGMIVDSSPSLGFSYRGLAFDSAGNLALSENDGFAVGLRLAQPNGIKQLDGVSSGTTRALLKGSGYDNVGTGVALLEGAGSSELLVAAVRANNNATTGFSTNVTDQSLTVTSVDTRNIQLRNLNGSVGTLSQTALAGGEDGISSPFTSELKNFAVTKDANNNPVLFAVSYVENRVDIYSLEPTWTAGAGTWSNSSNWLIGLVPNSGLQNAKFGAAASPTTITLSDARTTKNLKLDSANSYSFSGSGTLTLDGPDAWGGNITVINGSHNIGVPLVLNKSANLTVTNATDILTISGDITATGKGVTKRGAGTAIVKNLRLSALALRGGTLSFASNGTASGTSKTGTLTIDGATDAWTSTLDLSNNAIAVDYTGTSPIADIQNQIKSGYASGAWTGTGIRSSAAASSVAPNKGAIAYAENSSLALTPALFGQVTVDADTVLVMYTLAGDATMDRKVNTLDFNVLANNFSATGQNWVQGDFNYDGTVDSSDFNALTANFGASLPASGPSLGSVVPEPASLSVIGFALSGMLLRRRK